MKLVTFDDYRLGILVEGGAVDLSEAVGSAIMALPGPSRMSALIERWNDLRDTVATAAKSRAPIASYKLRVPIPRPGKMLFGVGNYHEGVVGGKPTPFDMFVKLPSTIVDPGEEVILPSQRAQLFFHEAELGFVIGKTARNVSEANALDHVFGYCCVNDVSSWGLYGSTGGLHNKNFDTFLSFGPCIVTADEIIDPHDLDIRLWVDGSLRQNYNTSDMEHRIPAIVAWASSIVTLEPGDLMACGTNHDGIGPIQDGEVMRLEISGLGAIENPVRDALKRRWPVGPDHQFSNWVRRYKETGETDGEFFSVRELD